MSISLTPSLYEAGSYHQVLTTRVNEEGHFPSSGFLKSNAFKSIICPSHSSCNTHKNDKIQMLGNVCVLVIWVSRPYIAQTLAFSVSFSQIINLALSAVYMPGQTVYSVRWMPIRNNFQGISQHVRLLKCAVIRSFRTQGPASAKHSSMTWGHGTASETCQLLWNTGRCVKLHIYMPIKDRVSDLNNL